MYTDDMIDMLRKAGHSESEIVDIVREDIEMDERIQKAAYKEWLNVLVKMWDAVDKEVDEKRLAVYAEQFHGVPMGLLEQAVNRAIRNNGSYLTVPSVGALWTAIKHETGNLPNVDVIEAVQLWCQRVDAAFEESLYYFRDENAVVSVETEVA